MVFLGLLNTPVRITNLASIDKLSTLIYETPVLHWSLYTLCLNTKDRTRRLLCRSNASLYASAIPFLQTLFNGKSGWNNKAYTQYRITMNFPLHEENRPLHLLLPFSHPISPKKECYQ